MAEFNETEDIPQQEESVDAPSSSSAENVIDSSAEVSHIMIYEGVSTNQYMINFSQAHEYLSAKGGSIKEISMCYFNSENQLKCDGNSSDGRDVVHDALNTIADLCGNTLIRLRIGTNHINFDISKLKALQKLDIGSALIDNLGSHPELKELVVRSCKFGHNFQFKNQFPGLQEVIFSCNDELTDEKVIEFQRFNSQLKSFTFTTLSCADSEPPVTSMIFREISNRMPNLEQFQFDCSYPRLLKMRYDIADILCLTDLKKLKRLEMSGNESHNRKALIEGLVENDVPIEFLNLDRVNPDYVESLPQLKLTGLVLNSVPEDMLIECIMRMPTLRYLRAIGDFKNIGFVKRILECAPHLDKLLIPLKKAIISLEDYNSLLAVAINNNSNVEISLFNCTLNVSDDLLNANRNNVDIIERLY